MSRCYKEPVPQQFYAPAGLFSESDLRSLGAIWLGDRIFSPGKSFCYQVTSGPLCRLYWDGDRPMPHSFESAWHEVKGKWRKEKANYLSYAIDNGQLITVRW